MTIKSLLNEIPEVKPLEKHNGYFYFKVENKFWYNIKLFFRKLFRIKEKVICGCWGRKKQN